MSYVLFDIGGTSTRVAVSDDLKTFSEPKKFKTLNNFDKGIESIAAAVKELTDEEIRGAAGGVRGILDADKAGIVRDPGGVLTDWEEKSIVEALNKKLKTTTYLENDAALFALGEAQYGAGEGYNIVAYHTVSTGVGGARIDGGMIDATTHGFEPGHQFLDIDQTILGEGVDATLENLVSGSSLESRTGEKPYDIEQGDAVWNQLAEYLAYGLHNTIVYWSPGVIVLGGSMILGDPRILLNDIITHTHGVVGDTVEVPEIVDAELGDFGGLYGAMALLSQNV